MRERFPDLITIKSDGGADDNPDPNYSHTVVANLPARCVAVGGGETIRGKQVEAHIKWVIELRRRSGLTPRMRVEVVGGGYVGTQLQVDKVIPVTQHGFRPVTQLHCTELD